MERGVSEPGVSVPVNAGCVISQPMIVFHFGNKDAACNHLMSELSRYAAFLFSPIVMHLERYPGIPDRLRLFSLVCLQKFIPLYLFLLGLHLGSLESIVKLLLHLSTLVTSPSPIPSPVT